MLISRWAAVALIVAVCAAGCDEKNAASSMSDEEHGRRVERRMSGTIEHINSMLNSSRKYGNERGARSALAVRIDDSVSRSIETLSSNSDVLLAKPVILYAYIPDPSKYKDGVERLILMWVDYGPRASRIILEDINGDQLALSPELEWSESSVKRNAESMFMNAGSQTIPASATGVERRGALPPIRYNLEDGPEEIYVKILNSNGTVSDRFLIDREERATRGEK